MKNIAVTPGAIANHQYMKTPSSYTDIMSVSGANQNASRTFSRGWYRIVLRNGAYLECGGITICAAPSSGETQFISPIENGVVISGYTSSSSSSQIIVRMLVGA